MEESLLDHDMSHSVAQLEVFPTDLQMRRIDPACNMRRFYRMSIQPDLFGGASLVREWGRKGTALVSHPKPIGNKPTRPARHICYIRSG